MKEKVQNLAHKYFDEVIKIRRHIHAHPELSFKEFETSAFLAGKLEELGIPFQKMAGTGLVALIKGKNPGKKTIALRGDIDALPIHEANEVVYKSQNEGIMHACGHDVHSSSLLGAGMILNDLKDQFEGTVKLIFQPGEEKLPGGASIMIKEGVLENPKPEVIFGQHVIPELECGTVGFKSGKFMASADEIYLTIKGKGGHAALPHKVIDPVLITCNLIVSLQQVISRRANPIIPSVLSFGHFEAIGATNIIPDEVKIKGTFRTFNEGWRAEAHEIIRKMTYNIVESMGGKAELDLEVGYPYLENDEKLTGKAKQFAIEYLGKDKVVDLEMRATAEDFAYFSQEMPACFYRLGVANSKKGIISGLHTPTFNVDEESLLTGIGLMAYIALSELNANS